MRREESIILVIIVLYTYDLRTDLDRIPAPSMQANRNRNQIKKHKEKEISLSNCTSQAEHRSHRVKSSSTHLTRPKQKMQSLAWTKQNNSSVTASSRHNLHQANSTESINQEFDRRNKVKVKKRPGSARDEVVPKKLQHERSEPRPKPRLYSSIGPCFFWQVV